MKRTPPSVVSKFTDGPADRRKRLRRLVILILLVSVGIHVVAGIGAGIWVIARYLTQPKAQFTVQKQVKMTADNRQHQLAIEEVTSLRPRAVVQNRIQSLRPSKLALPELPRVPIEATMPIDLEALVSDQVDGVGRHSGEGEARAGGGFFGGSGLAHSGLLEGTFYDLKQTPDGSPTELANPGKDQHLTTIGPLLRNFVKNWNPAPLRKYFQGPAKLYASQLSIPQMSADVGPKEFGLGAKVKPRYWLVHYKGRVIAPKTGQFRFVGAGDDTLIVRFDRKNVLDASFWPVWRSQSPETMDYGNDLFTPTGNSKGYIVGETFRVEEGKAYDIEIVLSEYGGGLFQGVLLIQDMDETYREKNGVPILPFFKLQPSNMEASARAKLPPYDRNAPLWIPAAQAVTPGEASGVR